MLILILISVCSGYDIVLKTQVDVCELNNLTKCIQLYIVDSNTREKYSLILVASNIKQFDEFILTSINALDAVTNHEWQGNTTCSLTYEHKTIFTQAYNFSQEACDKYNQELIYFIYLRPYRNKLIAICLTIALTIIAICSVIMIYRKPIEKCMISSTFYNTYCISSFRSLPM